MIIFELLCVKTTPLHSLNKLEYTGVREMYMLLQKLILTLTLMLGLIEIISTAVMRIGAHYCNTIVFHAMQIGRQQKLSSVECAFIT